MKKKAIFNWSGGKDSALCLHYALKNNDISIVSLVTTINKANNRVSMHGVQNELLQMQAANIGLPLKQIPIPENTLMEEYDRIMKAGMDDFVNCGVEYSIFGDIFLEDLRLYREEKLKETGMKALFPLWKKSSTELLNEFIELGFKAVIVCVNAKYLDASFLGRTLDKNLLADLPANVDPCGENGEYHSFVYDGPIFKSPISFLTGETVEKEYPRSANISNDDRSDDLFDTRFYYMDVYTDAKK